MINTFNKRETILKRLIILLYICIIPFSYSCSKKHPGPVDMTPIFLAVHKQASIQAKDYEGKFYQFDSTKPFYIYTDYNFQGSIREPLEGLISADSSQIDDKLIGNKVFIEQSSQLIAIDTLPKWDDIHKRVQLYREKLYKNDGNSTFREFQDSGEFDYYLVRMLKPVFDKNKSLYSTAIHIIDNVFENEGFYYSVKFRIVDNKIKVISARQYEFKIGLPPLEPKHKHGDGTPPPKRRWTTTGG